MTPTPAPYLTITFNATATPLNPLFPENTKEPLRLVYKWYVSQFAITLRVGGLNTAPRNIRDSQKACRDITSAAKGMLALSEIAFFHFLQ